MSATKIDVRLWNLTDMLRKLDFTPEEHGRTTYREEWFIRQVRGGTQHLRVVIHPDDGNAVDVHYLDQHFASDWDAQFDGSAPHAVIRAALKAAIGA